MQEKRRKKRVNSVAHFCRYDPYYYMKAAKMKHEKEETNMKNKCRKSRTISVAQINIRDP